MQLHSHYLQDETKRKGLFLCTEHICIRFVIVNVIPETNQML